MCFVPCIQSYSATFNRKHIFQNSGNCFPSPHSLIIAYGFTRPLGCVTKDTRPPSITPSASGKRLEIVQDMIQTGTLLIGVIQQRKEVASVNLPGEVGWWKCWFWNPQQKLKLKSATGELYDQHPFGCKQYKHKLYIKPDSLNYINTATNWCPNAI